MSKRSQNPSVNSPQLTLYSWLHDGKVEAPDLIIYEITGKYPMQHWEMYQLKYRQNSQISNC